MRAVATKDAVLARLSASSSSSSPRVLREEMAMPRDYRTESEHLDDAYDFWLALKDAHGCAPDWSAFKPFKHPALLPHIMLYQRSDDRYRCSIVGEQAGEYMPVKLAGSFIDEVVPAANLTDMMRRFDTALDTATPNFVEKTMAWEPGYDRRSYRALQLPFPGQDGAQCRILSVMDFRVERA